MEKEKPDTEVNQTHIKTNKVKVQKNKNKMKAKNVLFKLYNL